MTTPILTRAAKGSALIWSELDLDLTTMRDAIDGNAASQGIAIASLQAGQSSGSIGFTSYTAMIADLNHNAGTTAILAGDSTPSNDGTYVKTGSYGSGSWVKQAFANPSWVNANLYSSFAAAVEAQGVNKRHLIVSTPMSISAPLTTPYTLTVQIIGGGSIETNGHALTLSGPFIAGDEEVLTGSGAINFGSSSFQIIKSVWGGEDNNRLTIGDSVSQALPLISMTHYSNQSLNALNIYNMPGSTSAQVIHNYSGFGYGLQIDNTYSADILHLVNTENAINSPGTKGTGNFISFLGYSGDGYAATGTAATPIGRLSPNLEFIANLYETKPFKFYYGVHVGNAAISNPDVLDNYHEGTWEPVVTNLSISGTGSVTFAGRYTQYGDQINFCIRIIITGDSTTSCTQGSVYISLPTVAAIPSTCAAANIGTGVGFGTGLVVFNGLGSNAFPPAWTNVPYSIVISGTYTTQ